MTNDYELIYLITTENSEEALRVMIGKYSSFIWKMIHQFHLKPIEHDDFFQEGLIVLDTAIKTFDPSRNKTFTKFFELLLKRRYIKLKANLQNMILYEEPSQFEGSYTPDDQVTLDIPDFKPFEKMIYEYYFLKSYSIQAIADELKIDKKRIYNGLYRIKEKLRFLL